MNDRFSRYSYSKTDRLNFKVKTTHNCNELFTSTNFRTCIKKRWGKILLDKEESWKKTEEKVRAEKRMRRNLKILSYSLKNVFHDYWLLLKMKKTVIMSKRNTWDIQINCRELSQICRAWKASRIGLYKNQAYEVGCQLNYIEFSKLEWCHFWLLPFKPESQIKNYDTVFGENSITLLHYKV